jgi:hypothetical protein
MVWWYLYEFLLVLLFILPIYVKFLAHQMSLNITKETKIHPEQTQFDHKWRSSLEPQQTVPLG